LEVPSRWNATSAPRNAWTPLAPCATRPTPRSPSSLWSGSTFDGGGDTCKARRNRNFGRNDSLVNNDASSPPPDEGCPPDASLDDPSNDSTPSAFFISTFATLLSQSSILNHVEVACVGRRLHPRGVVLGRPRAPTRRLTAHRRVGHGNRQRSRRYLLEKRRRLVATQHRLSQQQRSTSFEGSPLDTLPSLH
jgi:hypothetical protein